MGNGLETEEKFIVEVGRELEVELRDWGDDGVEVGGKHVEVFLSEVRERESLRPDSSAIDMPSGKRQQKERRV